MNSGGRPLLRIIEDFIATCQDLRTRPATEHQRRLADQLRDELAAIAADTGAMTPFWQGICASLRSSAARDDPLFFMRWPAVSASMIPRTTLPIIRSYWALRRSGQWRDVWSKALHHPLYGYGPPFPFDLHTTPLAVQHAGHLLHYERVTGRRFTEADCIVELGGGYGSLCRIVDRLGFKGRYVIFDLPLVMALQRYYLRLHDIPPGQSEGHLVQTDSLPNVVAAMLPETVVISTWALSEMPLDLRARIETLLLRDECRNVLFSYQSSFCDVDNVAWFRGLDDRTKARWSWHHTPIDGDNAYMVGTRRNTHGSD